MLGELTSLWMPLRVPSQWKYRFGTDIPQRNRHSELDIVQFGDDLSIIRVSYRNRSMKSFCKRGNCLVFGSEAIVKVVVDGYVTSMVAGAWAVDHVMVHWLRAMGPGTDRYGRYGNCVHGRLIGCVELCNLKPTTRCDSFRAIYGFATMNLTPILGARTLASSVSASYAGACSDQLEGYKYDV